MSLAIGVRSCCLKSYKPVRSELRSAQALTQGLLIPGYELRDGLICLTEMLILSNYCVPNPNRGDIALQ